MGSGGGGGQKLGRGGAKLGLGVHEAYCTLGPVQYKVSGFLCIEMLYQVTILCNQCLPPIRIGRSPRMVLVLNGINDSWPLN